MSQTLKTKHQGSCYFFIKMVKTFSKRYADNISKSERNEKSSFASKIYWKAPHTPCTHLIQRISTEQRSTYIWSNLESVSTQKLH